MKANMSPEIIEPRADTGTSEKIAQILLREAYRELSATHGWLVLEADNRKRQGATQQARSIMGTADRQHALRDRIGKFLSQKEAPWDTMG